MSGGASKLSFVVSVLWESILPNMGVMPQQPLCVYLASTWTFSTHPHFHVLSVLFRVSQASQEDQDWLDPQVLEEEKAYQAHQEALVFQVQRYVLLVCVGEDKPPVPCPV